MYVTSHGILPQAVITLNMLRTSRINPKLSAATHIFKQYDFNRAPLAPPGTRTIAHETPGRKRTWAPHGQDGWYIGPALEHYRCYTVYITKTRSSRVVETVEFFPHRFKLQFPSSSELATQAAADLTHALLNPQPAGPFCQVGNEQEIALKRLSNIFGAAKLKRGKEQLTLQDEVENNAPQRVQTTVSPPRVTSQKQGTRFFYMANTTKNNKKLTNGAILIISKVLTHVMSSAAEAEIGAVFINAKEGAVLMTTLEELGHKHPPHQWKLTIPLLQGTSMGQSNKNAQKPWTCAFIESKIG
jgi:hypothetical protein